MSTDRILKRYVRHHHMSDFFRSDHSIGGCIISILLITSLLHRTECNRNGGNQLNRAVKNLRQLLYHNHADPTLVLNHSNDNKNSSINRSMPITNISIPSSSSSAFNALDFNYVLSFLQNLRQNTDTGNTDKRSPQLHGITQSVSEEKDAIVKDSEVIVLGAEDKRGIHEANKLSLFSSSLNVIDDGSPEDTQLAHNVLVIHRPKLNRTAPTTAHPINSSLYYQITKPTELPLIRKRFTTASTTTTQSYPTPVKNNHRPLHNRPWKIKPPMILSSTTPVPPKTEPTETIFKTSPVFEDEIPTLVINNHQRPAFSPFTRQKLSTEYALFFTTPIGAETTSVEPSVRPPPYEESVTPHYSTTSMIPTHVTPLNHFSSSIVSVNKRPPIKINYVHANNVKYPDAIHSHELTVLDPPFGSGLSMRLPPNTTVLHKNIIVPYKPGRPTPPLPTTTQFPVYPVVAGITNWQSQTTQPAFQWHPHKPTTQWTYPSVTTMPPPTTSFTLPPQTIVVDPNNIVGTVGTIGTIGTVGTTEAAQESTYQSQPSYESIGQTVHRPTIVTLGTSSIPVITRPPPVEPQRHPSSSHIVTVTPIKSSSSPYNTYFVTQAHTPRPSPSTTTTTEYANAVQWAPPIPSPPQPYPSQQKPISGGWFWPFSNLFAVDSSSTNIFGFLTILKAVVYFVLVMFLPPLTLAAAIMQAAG